MAVLAVTSAHPEANASTWIFLGVLALLTAGMLIGWAEAISHYRPPAPRDDLVSAERYYAVHGIHDEIDLGRQWRSTDDPGAYWHVWWLPESGRIIGVRTSVEPPPVARYMSGGFRRYSWGQENTVIGGMKTLGTTKRPDRHAMEHLRVRPDGLDQLCGGTGSRGHLLVG